MPDRPRVLSLESRRGEEMATLIRKFGGEPTVAPSMREVPLEDNAEAAAAGERLLAGGFDVSVFLTGVGASAWMGVLEPRHGRAAVIEALANSVVCVRGPKPAAVMKDWGVPVAHRAPAPNTWEDLVATLDREGCELRDRQAVVQEYGTPNRDLHAALRDRGADVTSVGVYRWAMPEDRGPLERAVRGVCEGAFDVVLVTSAQQIRHAAEAADGLGVRGAFDAGVAKARLCSIGPTATACLRDEYGYRVDAEPKSPKMGPLVREALA